MKTAVTYARYSCANQHESSIEAQRDAMAKWCAARGVEIVAEYADRAASGTKVAGRDEFLQMLSDLKTRKVDYVLVHKYDRFARNQNDQYFYMAMIEKRGAKLVAVAQEFGDGPEARFMLGVISAYNAFYSENLANEVRKGRSVVISQGRFPGGMIPFGYESDGKGGLKLVEVEAYFLRRIFDAILYGTERQIDIINEMNDAGIVGRRGHPFTHDRISRLSRNIIYAGVFQMKKPDGTVVRIDNHHEAIITLDEYEEVQRIVKSRSNAGRANATIFLLTGITYCGACGAKIYAAKNPSKFNPDYCNYFCTECKGFRRIPTKELELDAIEYYNEFISPENQARITNAAQSCISRLTASANRRRPATEREIQKLQREVDSLVANMASGILDAQTLSLIGDQISSRRAKIEILKESITPPDPVAIPNVAEYFEGATPVSYDMDKRYLRSTLHKYIARVTVHTTDIEITSTFDEWFASRIKILQNLASVPPEATISTTKIIHRIPSTWTHGCTFPLILTNMGEMHKGKKLLPENQKTRD